MDGRDKFFTTDSNSKALTRDHFENFGYKSSKKKENIKWGEESMVEEEAVN